MRYTERSLRIFKLAEKEAERTTQIVYPVHLLLGILRDRTGVCGELCSNYPGLKEILLERLKELPLDKEEGCMFEPFSINVSESTKVVLENANTRMKRFKQIYINEGHIVEAIFKINDPIIRVITDGLDISLILEIMSYPRDMIVHLKEYVFPDIPKSNLIIRKADFSDELTLKTFVEKEFGDGWLSAIENGFLQKDIPIFISLDKQEIVGFACYDVVRSKKGLFGPMGISLTNRIQGIGYALLHYSLVEMKKIGYEYAVIGEAGPIEFYEKACNAVVIPRRYMN